MSCFVDFKLKLPLSVVSLSISILYSHTTDALTEKQLPDISDRYKNVISSKRASKKANSYGEIWPESRTLLKKFYAPYNVLLAELLQDKRFLQWNE